MRKAFWVIIFVLAAFLLALWSPWRDWQINFSELFGVTPPQEVAGLQVSSLAGELLLYVDDSVEPVATVSPENSPVQVPGIQPGDHQIKLVRTSEVEGTYVEFNRLIYFYSGIDVVIAYELGPTLEFSEGHVIYATEQSATDSNAYLNISSNVEGASVSIDQVTIGSTPIVKQPIDTLTQHRVVITKDGYEQQDFTVLPEEASDREKLAGLKLNIDVDLFLQPLQVNNALTAN